MADPVVSLGTISSPVARTGLQGVSGAFIAQGIELWIHSFTPDQRAWLVVALTTVLAFVQNQIEQRAGRKLIGVTK